MEAKKTRRADLQNRRIVFMEIGLVIALGAVVGAFAWGQSEKTVIPMTDKTAVVEEEMIVNTEQEQKPPEVKPQINQVFSEFLDIVRNDTQIDTDYNFDDFSEDLEIPVPQAVEEEVVDDAPLFNAEEMPTFQGGGLETFRAWVDKQLKYPTIASENNISGRVILQFVIERDGSLTGITELASPDRSLTEEAIRVLKLSPKWTPGKTRNRPVRIYMQLPVDFQLQPL